MFLIERCNGQSVFGNACTGGANRKNLFFGRCTGGANRKNLFGVVAPVVQIAKTFFWSLHRWCKSQKPLFGRCTGGANRKNLFLAVAPAVQIAKTFLRSLHRRCKHFQKRFGRRMTSVETLIAGFILTSNSCLKRRRLRGGRRFLSKSMRRAKGGAPSGCVTISDGRDPGSDA